MPVLDVSETDTQIVVRAEVPGMDPKDIDISIMGDTLTVKGEKKEEISRKEENIYPHGVPLRRVREGADSSGVGGCRQGKRDVQERHPQDNDGQERGIQIADHPGKGGIKPVKLCL